MLYYIGIYIYKSYMIQIQTPKVCTFASCCAGSAEDQDVSGVAREATGGCLFYPFLLLKTLFSSGNDPKHVRLPKVGIISTSKIQEFLGAFDTPSDCHASCYVFPQDLEAPGACLSLGSLWLAAEDVWLFYHQVEIDAAAIGWSWSPTASWRCWKSLLWVQRFIADTFTPTSNSISIFLRKHALVESASAFGAGTIEVRSCKVSR